MKTREERTGRSSGRSYNGPPGSITGVGPSPFLSRPSSPPGSKPRSAAEKDVDEQSGIHFVPAVAGAEPEQDLKPSDQADQSTVSSVGGDDGGKRSRHTTSSTEHDASPGAIYPPSRSVSGIRPLAGGSPSFMMGSWAGYSSKAGIVGLGSHSLMQYVQLYLKYQLCI